VDIDPVEKGTGNARAVLVDLTRSTGAGQGIFTTPAALAGVC
jgi:hypothetical protein